MTLVGTDVGGTFTDLAAWTGSEVRFSKSPTTQVDSTEGILACFSRASLDPSVAEVVFHGTTAIINALLERKGARTALLTTEGFRDVYEIGRGSRWDVYDMLFEKPTPLVPRPLRKGVPERVRADGKISVPLDRERATAIVRELVAEDVEALAICFLHAYANPAHELEMLRIVDAVAPGLARCASHELVREYREYERTSTTVLNAYVTPGAGRYIARLKDRFRTAGMKGEVLMMQSNGGCTDIDHGARVPLALLESGPSSGAIAAAELARHLDLHRIVAFDMGGTTAKAILIEDFQLRTSRPYYVGGERLGLPSLLPVLDLVEVGTGGGSKAYLDEVGALKVGPESAGSVPGPACYGLGGVDATVTDADLVLGRLSHMSFFGGEMPLSPELARGAIASIGAPFEMSTETAAAGITRIADNAMALAVRQVSIERGRDPRDLTLVAFGGAGPVHAASVARQLGIRQLVVPVAPATFSAFGMLQSDLKYELTQTFIAELSAVDPDQLLNAFGALEQSARERAALTRLPETIEIERFVEVRYVGQEHTLAISLAESDGDIRLLEHRYHEEHERAYGFSVASEPLQTVNLRLTMIGRLPRPPMPAGGTAHRSSAASTRTVVFDGSREIATPTVRRETLSGGTSLEGPLIIEEAASTTVLHPPDRGAVDEMGNLWIEIGERYGD